MPRARRVRGARALSLRSESATFGSGACSSSDSSSDNGADAGKDGPLWTAPGAIVSVSPAENDDNVSVHAPIQITYDEAVQVTPQSVTLSGPNSAVIATTARSGFFARLHRKRVPNLK